MVSRNEGYRRGAGKEAVAISILREFLRETAGNPGTVIDDPDENYLHGDLRFSPAVTLECKGQPIDPDRYPQNFVEVFETTRNPRHSGGFAGVAGLLGLDEAALAAVTVRTGATTSALGVLPFVSTSITSIASSALTAYVNYNDGGRHIYLYRRDEILGHLRRAVVGNGLVRGAGNSNEDTFAVFVPLPSMRWARRNGAWVATGETEERVARGVLADLLGPGGA